MRKNSVVLLAAACVALGGTAATGSEIVYHPVNPSFGGSGLNGSYLLSQAQGQGQGVKSGAQAADLSGLNNALNNLGSSTNPGSNNPSNNPPRNSTGGQGPATPAGLAPGGVY